MFRVLWLQEALNDLTNLWLQSDSGVRQAVTAATHLLDQELKLDPFRQSEARKDEERIAFLYPLGLLFEVDLKAKIVWVLHVWRFRRKGE